MLNVLFLNKNKPRKNNPGFIFFIGLSEFENLGNDLFRREAVSFIQFLYRHPVGKFFVRAEIQNLYGSRAVETGNFSPKPPSSSPFSNVTTIL